jgi:hypothetical protein
MAVEVIVQTAVFWFIGSGSPSGGGCYPPLRKAAGTLSASNGSAVGNETRKKTLNKI